MLKLLGAIFILTATTWTGFEIAKIYVERPRQIRQLRAALQSLEVEIMYGHTPLHIASGQIAKQLSRPVSLLFQIFSERLEKGSDSAKTAWEQSLKKTWHSMAMKKSEYDVLKQFGETLGLHDRVSQQKHIKLALTHLEAAEADAGRAQAKNEKMVKSLGFLAGLLLILLLM
ncbi:stage III sporulation protein SpoAB [Bacillus sp. ISL-51]|uniref:stage III sporulation protein SpoIIIAB n=1 Tax=unclassified Bacillus (in: firmicutes) TaxID=185979 RepID=UPI001BE629C2|nr:MULTISPECIES: stage III sporulation protein SpoIIIAB [unclassified Bacillus (in: firmicutes)]MBT2574466.1 stage III sporulation protein SpoAB [Bacillus sp. ISL-51]MBT2633283.1 stage III sporulation protein SpoAB [Bacillus sp. ISL-26]